MLFQFANKQQILIVAEEPNTILSVINVADVQGEITDVNVVVDVDHTFTSDLEISLIGPEGARVVLVSGEGEKQDNFILTEFDDEALQPITAAGAPFTGTFKPEESLDTFNEHGPNGAWTLEIKDSAFEDGGTLKSWALEIEVPDLDANNLFYENSNPLTIDSGDKNTVVSAIHVTGYTDRLLESIQVKIDVDHDYNRDLTITLISPDNQRVKLVDQRGGEDNNFKSTVFSDDANKPIAEGKSPFNGVFRPEESLSSLNGINITGAWLLEVVDNAWDDGGTLNSWSLQLVTRLATDEPSEQVTSKFNIVVEFLGGLSSTQQAVFHDAATRWSEIIIGELPEENIDGVIVKGVHIGAKGASIDSVGGVLGQAGPTHLRQDSYLPAIGIMSFDTADLENMEADGSLLDVIIHEMGHVIGIGTIWQLQGLLQDAGTLAPLFTGPLAQAEYASLLGSASVEDVPVEGSQAGPGTADGHWQEFTFGPELMTGYINSGMKNSISRLTVAALDDMGYDVNMDAADDYSLPDLSLRTEMAIRPRGRTCTFLHNTEPFKVNGMLLNLTASEVSFMEQITWDLSLGTAGGLAIGDSGNADVDAVTTIPVILDATKHVDLELQLADTTKLVMFAITSTIYDGNVEVTGGGSTFKITGPLILYGSLIKHFSSDLSTLNIINKHTTETAKLNILIGRKLA